MAPMSLEQKQQQFHEFFTIKHAIKVNLVPMPKDFQLPELEQLVDHMPYAFRIASELSNIEANNLRPLRMLNEQAKELVDYLNQQSRKIDLIMSYVLHQQDEEQQRFETAAFGGGGLIVRSDEPLALETIYQTKLFVDSEAAAIFCFAEVIACQAEADEYHVSLIFSRIREQDQELLVRASLHLQTQQLKKRSQARN